MSRSSGHRRSGSSPRSTTGGSSRLFDGRNDEQVAHVVEARLLVGATRTWRHRDLVAWLIAPPSSSSVTSSPVTVFTTSGPVMNMWLDSRTMKMKSVMAGRVHRAAGARAEDHRDLRDHAGRQHVAVEDPAVAGEADHALLDAGAGAVVEADDRRTDLEGEVHQLVDLLGEHLAERAAEDREVLARTRTPCDRRSCPSR